VNDSALQNRATKIIQPWCHRKDGWGDAGDAFPADLPEVDTCQLPQVGADFPAFSTAM
jgi:hypothetical protein